MAARPHGTENPPRPSFLVHPACHCPPSMASMPYNGMVRAERMVPMVRETNIVHVEPDSELGHLLDQVDGTPLRLEKDGVNYILSREDEGRPIMSDEEYQRILDETL